MKRIAVLVLLVLSGTSYSQKKKKVIPPPSAVVIAKIDNASAEVFKDAFYLIVNAGAKKDSLLLKKYTAKTTPIECKIISFTAKGTPLYYVSWIEKTTTETKLKKEETVVTESQIWNPSTKTIATTNTQGITKIRETVFLDRLKNASETQERTRSSGFLFTFLDGDFSLKDKSSENKFTYNASTMKYERVNTTPPAATKPAKKKRK